MDELITKRPRGLVPGSLEWLREIQGPRLLQRLVDVVHCGEPEDMTPTQARCAGMLLPIIYPTLSAVHHTVETTLAKVSTEELEARFAQLMQAQKAAQQLEASQAQTVEFTEVPTAVPEESNHDR